MSEIETLLHPEVELRSLISLLGESRSYVGYDGIREYLRALGESFTDASWEFEGVVAEAPEVVVVLGRFRARGRGSGIEVDELIPQAWRWRDGRGYRNEAYRTVEEALRAAGL